jgi:hypothetical protein
LLVAGFLAWLPIFEQTHLFVSRYKLAIRHTQSDKCGYLNGTYTLEGYTMSRLQILVLALLLTVNGLSCAENYKNITRTLYVDELSSLRIEFSVGELEVEVWDGESIELDIELKSQRSWLSWRRRKVEDIELEVRISSDEVFLGIDADKLNQQWVVKMPAKLALDVDLGVGEIRIDGLDNNLALELGVGEIEVIAATDNFDYINVSVGVGDVSLRGFGSGTENERSFVSADAHFEGQGDYQIEAALGVGEVLIRLD